MNETHRHRQLIALLDERKVLSTAEIIDFLQISPATARRDINKLSQLGKLRKVRNGAESIKHGNALQQQLFNVTNSHEKMRIAQAAANLCPDHDSVILTCGSTMMILGNQLCTRNVQIITNSLPLANHLIENDHENVVIMGGQYNKSQAITLWLNNSNEAPYAANTLFTSGRGITKNGLYKTDIIIATSERKMIDKVSKIIVLLDSAKLGKQQGMLFCDLSEIDLLITGKEADPTVVEELRAVGLEVMLV